MIRRSWIFLLIAALVVGGVYVIRRQKPQEPETVRVERTTVTQEVSFTGRVQARDAVQLGFVEGGRVARVLVDVGQSVQRGQLLAVLDTRTLALEAARTEAVHAAARADAEVALRAAEEDLVNTQGSEAATLEKLRQTVRDAKVELDAAEDVRQKSIRDNSDQSLAAERDLLVVRKARSAYHTAQEALLVGLRDAAQAEAKAAAAVERAQTDLVEQQQAAAGVPGLPALGASAASAQVRLQNASLHSPFAGVVTEVGIVAGELAATGAPLISVQTPAPYDIVADVPETDIRGLTAGQIATVAFDALGADTQLEATIRAIDPAAVLVEGVPTFRVTLRLPTGQPDLPASAAPKALQAGLRLGMTANISVEISERENVFALPQRAVVKRNGTAAVRVLTDDGRIEERTVRTGLQGSIGEVEITEGLSGGEHVIVSDLNERASGR